MKTMIIGLAAILALAALSASSALAQNNEPGPAPLSEHWVGTWATAPQLTEPGNLPAPPGLVDTTLRQIVHVSIGGQRLRVRFTNAYGAVPLTILSAHIAQSAGQDAIQTSTDTPLTFAGQTSVIIPQGAPMVSDPVAFPLAPKSNLVITVYVKDATTAITGHPGSRTTSYLVPGNMVTAPNLEGAETVAHWYYIQGVDVVADKTAAAVVTLGDSITDGRGSTTDANNRWPDNLAARLLANNKTQDVAVLNMGIGGNNILHDGLGPSVLARVDRDVLSQPGARWVIFFEGINDLGGHQTSDAIIAGMSQVITRVHARGILIYGATITPCGASFYDSPSVQTYRTAINTWIRTSGSFDGVIDFDAVVRDPANPLQLQSAYDSGDHLHLSPAGYRAMAAAIDLKLFEH